MGLRKTQKSDGGSGTREIKITRGRPWVTRSRSIVQVKPSPSLPANLLKRSAVYSSNRKSKVKMEFNPKYEEVGGMLECEYIEAWSRKILVARRSLRMSWK